MNVNLRKRFLSLFIDGLVIVGYTLCLLCGSLLFYIVFLKAIPSFNELQSNLISFLTLILPVFLYLVVFECASKHATVGKKKAGIMVASISGTLHTWQVVVRNTLKLLPWQLAHMAMFNVFANDSVPTLFFYTCIVGTYVLPVINISCMVIRKDKRSLHDLFAKTVVLKII